MGGHKCVGVFLCLACFQELEKNDHVQGAKGQGLKGSNVPSFVAHHVQVYQIQGKCGWICAPHKG